MECLNCKKNVPVNSSFCPYCGHELSYTCAKCGAKCSLDYSFCNVCGTSNQSHDYVTFKSGPTMDMDDNKISLTPEYIESYEYILRMNKKRNLKLFWSGLLSGFSTLIFFALLYVLAQNLYFGTTYTGLYYRLCIFFENFTCILMMIAYYATPVFLPIIFIFIARSRKLQNRYFKIYFQRNPITGESEKLVLCALNYIKTMRSIMPRKLKKEIPKILHICYRYIHDMKAV